MKVVAFLPVKGTSERIENKNVRLLDGKPLFLHTLEKLVVCDFIDEVYLDSESEQIFELASNINCKYFRRDKRFASNKTDGHQLFYNEIKNIDADIYIQILATSPFIEKETIKKGIEILKTCNEYDSVVLVKKDKQYLWENDLPLYDRFYIPNSVDLPDTTVETMGLYIVKKETARKYKMRFGEKPYLLEAKPIEAVDVNYPDDFELANYIAAGKREQERKNLSNLKNYLTSSILSDIFDELGINGIIQNLKPNLSDAKLIGRAKTLKIRKLNPGEDPKGIYKTLESYETIVPDDVIVVENDLSDFAYFGELNANLALKYGAVGAIIGGKTRDTQEVKKLNFPVFATGNTCKDVKNRATLESINMKISLEDVEVIPGDLVFADSDGVAIIPQKLEEQVLSRAMEVIFKEKNILKTILLDDDLQEIKKSYSELN